MSTAPKRAVEIRIVLGADDWENAKIALEEVVDGLRKRLKDVHGPGDGKSLARILAAPARSFSVEVLEDRTQTHDRYFEQLDRYLESDRANDEREAG